MYAVTGTYYSYKYCDADELALGMTTVDTGSGTTVAGEDCVPMVYSGVKYEKCTSGDYSKLALLYNYVLEEIIILHSD